MRAFLSLNIFVIMLALVLTFSVGCSGLKPHVDAIGIEFKGGLDASDENQIDLDLPGPTEK